MSRAAWWNSSLTPRVVASLGVRRVHDASPLVYCAGAGQVGLQASFLWHHMARQHFMIATQRSATLQRSMRDEQ